MAGGDGTAGDDPRCGFLNRPGFCKAWHEPQFDGVTPMIHAQPPSLILLLAVLFVAQAVLFPILAPEANTITITAGIR